MLIVVPRALTQFAVTQLDYVDYTVANRLTHTAVEVVTWAYAHHAPWLAPIVIEGVKVFDDLGSMLIVIVLWLTQHTL